MARRAQGEIDWDAIQKQFRLGKKTNKQLAGEYGISPSSLGRKAEREGWVQDKVEEVDAVTNSLLIQAASGKQNPNATPNAIEIKAAAQANADVVMSHRHGLVRLKQLKTKMVDHLESIVDNFGNLAEVIEMVRNPDENGVDRANDRMRKAMDRSSVIDDLKKLAEIDEKVRKGEREAFGLDKDADSAASSVDDVIARIRNAE